MVFLLMSFIFSAIKNPGDYNEQISESGLTFEIHRKSIIIFHNPSLFTINTPYGTLTDHFSVNILDDASIQILLKDGSSSQQCYFSIFDYSNINNCYEFRSYVGDKSIDYLISFNSDADLGIQSNQDVCIFVSSPNTFNFYFESTGFNDNRKDLFVYSNIGNLEGHISSTSKINYVGKSTFVIWHTDENVQNQGNVRISSTEITEQAGDNSFISDQKEIPLTKQIMTPGDYSIPIAQQTSFTFDPGTIVIVHNPTDFLGTYKGVPCLGFGKCVFSISKSNPLVVYIPENAQSPNNLILYMSVVNILSYNCDSVEIYLGNNFMYTIGTSSMANVSMVSNSRQCQIFSSADVIVYNFFIDSQKNSYYINNNMISGQDMFSITTKTVISYLQCVEYQGSAGIQSTSIATKNCLYCSIGDYSYLSDYDFEMPVPNEGVTINIPKYTIIILHNPFIFETTASFNDQTITNVTSLNLTNGGTINFRPIDSYITSQYNSVAYFTFHPYISSTAICNVFDAYSGNHPSFAIVNNDNTYNASMENNQNLCILFTSPSVINFRFFIRNNYNNNDYLSIHSNEGATLSTLKINGDFYIPSKTVLMQWVSSNSNSNSRNSTGLYQSEIRKSMTDNVYERFIPGTYFSLTTQSYAGTMTSPPFVFTGSYEEEPDKKGLTPGVIAGIVVGCLVGAGIIILIIIVIVKRRKTPVSA